MQDATQKSRTSQTLWWNEPVVYWQANQVVVTFHSTVDRSLGAERVIASLHLDTLQQFLVANGFHLTSFTMQDVPHPEEPPPPELEQREGEEEPGSHGLSLNSPVGKYLYAPVSAHGTLAVCFFHSANASLSPASPSYGHSEAGLTMQDSTRAIVTLLNQNLDKLNHSGNVPIVAAMPNWVGGGTPITFNCPAAPPIPVTGQNTTYSNWHLTLPQLSPTLQEQDGDGVTVFVLDTIPTAEHIRSAARRAGSHNVLLQNIVKEMDGISSPSFVVDHQQLPKRLGENIQAGKDLEGNVFGFKMFDHGLFVAGIIRDLVPGANVECVRVLNDFGVGDTAILCDALQKIQGRIEQGTLAGPVVINLSLEFSPPDTRLPGIWFGNSGCCCFSAQDLATVIEELGLLRLGLHQVIQSLTLHGAVIVASSGNESNTRNHPPQRFGPRYPAAFPEVISAGAVDKNGLATSYSDYPALPPRRNGIATYGGAIPIPLPMGQPQEPPGAKTWANVDDAIVGVYSSRHYPMLLATDEPPGEYPAPDNSYSWAYWSGTSFATPIISSLTALVLKARSTGLLPTSMSVEDMITTGAGQQFLTATGSAFPTTTGFGAGVGVVQASQAGS